MTATRHWRCLRGTAGIVHLGSEEQGMRTSCGVLLFYVNGPLMMDNHPDNVNCRRCQRSVAMQWAQLAWRDATYTDGGWVLPEKA